MKKLLLLLLSCLFFIPGVFGIEIGKRTFEIGFNTDLDFSNDFLSVGDIFNKDRTIVLDLKELEDGFKLNLGFGVSPFYFNYNNKKSGWGFGLSTKVEAMGIINLSGKMLTFHETKNEDDGISEISGAAFAEIAAPIHLSYKGFKINIKPSVFYPLLYATSDISYTYFTDPNEGTTLNLGYDVNVYTPISMDDNSGSGLTAKPGVDFYLGVDFPISEVLGLNKIPLLDFDIGLELFGIPLFAGVMRDYMILKGSVGSDKPIKLFGEDDMDSFVDFDTDAKYGHDESLKISVKRPFKLLLHVDWRPLNNQIFKFTVTPSAGFAISPIYNETFSMEAGVKAAIDIGNLFIFSLGTGYHDRLWKNGFDLTLNLRVIELNLGLALCSPSFSKSWKGSGLALNLGFKSGW
jgi:hypothetical protein